MQKRKQQHGDEAPAKRAFQTENALIVERLIRVIPPERAEQTQHQARGKIFKGRCQHCAHHIQQNVIARKRAQHRKAEHGTKTVNDAERQMRKAAVFPFALFAADDDAFHDPAHKAVQKKRVEKHVQRNRLGINIVDHIADPFFPSRHRAVPAFLPAGAESLTC